MKVVISERALDSGESTYQFSCKLGNGAGRWEGPFAPVCGIDYEVEFEILASLRMGDNASVVKKCEPSIQTNGDDTWLIGKIDGIDPDGMAYLRLSKDCLIMLECTECKIRAGEQVALTISSSDLLIYPIGYTDR